MPHTSWIKTRQGSVNFLLFIWLISNAICPCTAVSTTLVLNTPVWIAHNGEKEIKYECIT